MKARHETRRAVAAGAVAAAACVALAAYAYLRDGAAQREFEGWIEAYFIFVSPDESGRVETLSVREGDPVTAGAPLFTLDSDLQRAAVAENEAAVANAKRDLRPRPGAAQEGGRLAEGVRRRAKPPCAPPRRGSTRRARGSTGAAW